MEKYVGGFVGGFIVGITFITFILMLKGLRG
jgi:hypothetical protein